MVARLDLLETKRLEIDVKIFEIDLRMLETNLGILENNLEILEISAKTPKIIVAFFFCSTLLDSTCFTIFTVSFVSFILYFYCIIVFYFSNKKICHIKAYFADFVNGAPGATIFEQQIGAVIIDWFYENAGFSFNNPITTANPEISQDYTY